MSKDNNGVEKQRGCYDLVFRHHTHHSVFYRLCVLCNRKTLLYL
jgi:hypothetical protein